MVVVVVLVVLEAVPVGMHIRIEARRIPPNVRMPPAIAVAFMLFETDGTDKNMRLSCQRSLASASDF